MTPDECGRRRVSPSHRANIFHRFWQPPRPRDTFVLVHGLGVSSRYMIPLAQVLAKQNAVYAPDLPGHGRSDRPPRVLNVRELASALCGWLDTVRVGRAVFVGNSMGAQILVELGDIAPERIKAAVLLG